MAENNRSPETATKSGSTELHDFAEKIDLEMIKVSKLVQKLRKVEKEELTSSEGGRAVLLQTRQLVSANKSAAFHRARLTPFFCLPGQELAAMQEHLKESIQSIDDDLTERGDSFDVYEKRNLMLKKAKILGLYGEKEKALEIYSALREEALSPNSKLSVIFEMSKLAIYFGDLESLQKFLLSADQLDAEKLDWEKRNQLKAYKAAASMAGGNFEEAAKLCCACLATFASEDLFTFDDLVFYSVALAVVSFERGDLKRKVVDSPEVMSAIDKVPELKRFCASVYDCEYELLFDSLSKIKPRFETDRFLGAYFEAFERRAKRVAYAQYLRAYLSVSLAAFADAFRALPAQVEDDLFSFISAGDLGAKIDKTLAVVRCNPKGEDNEALASVEEKGETLFTRGRRLMHLLAASS